MPEFNDANNSKEGNGYSAQFPKLHQVSQLTTIVREQFASFGYKLWIAR